MVSVLVFCPIKVDNLCEQTAIASSGISTDDESGSGRCLDTLVLRESVADSDSASRRASCSSSIDLGGPPVKWHLRLASCVCFNLQFINFLQSDGLFITIWPGQRQRP